MSSTPLVNPSPALVTMFGDADTPPYTLLLWVTSIVLVVSAWFVRSSRQQATLSQFPLFAEDGAKAKENFSADARGVVARGLKRFGASKPFRVVSELGEMLIIPPSMCHDVRNLPGLSFVEYMKESMCASIPGFEPFHEATRSSLLNDLVKTKLTPSLSKITDPLNQETAAACKDIFPNDQEWHSIPLKTELLRLVARLSARVFLGDEAVASNPDWLRITTEYTVDSFLASSELRTYPKMLQSFVHWFLPRCKKVRAQLREAESIIGPVIAARRRTRQSSSSSSPEQQQSSAGAGAGAGAASDTISWTEQIAQLKKFKYNPAALQLNLAVSAIHTTTDLLAQTMYCLLENPEYMPLLRSELESVLEPTSGRIVHSSLYKLKLMDSCIKEAQRLKPPMSVNMNRVAVSPTTLPLIGGGGGDGDGDGKDRKTPPVLLTIPKGTKLGVSSQAMWDDSVYPDSEKFDGHRFLRLREEEEEEQEEAGKGGGGGGGGDKWQLTTTRPEHIAFGHGRHACPGRFLAANEIKIALAHLLTGWEWRLKEGEEGKPRTLTFGIMMDSDPMLSVDVRKKG